MSVKKVEFESKTPNPNINGVEDVLVTEVHKYSNELCLIDVRRPDEWVGEFGHLAEAELMTLDTLPMRLQELPKDKSIVFICRSGARSAQAAAFAKENGFDSVYNMQGGMIAWTEHKLKSVGINGEDE